MLRLFARCSRTACAVKGAMERPGSRGSIALAATGISKAPTGSPIERPERPSTANRFSAPPPASGRGAPPGTASSRGQAGPPSTAYKRAGVLGGAAAGAPARGAPLVEARPLTQQGMAGLAKPGTSAGGRQASCSHEALHARFPIWFRVRHTLHPLKSPGLSSVHLPCMHAAAGVHARACICMYV